MGSIKRKCKKNVILKAWRSFGGGGANSNMRSLLLNKGTSKSFSQNVKGNILKTPNGCFSVYVGPQRQRFVVETKFVNHPLFKMLLDEAEVEYGFQNDGPIRLPCNVDLFYKVLAEMNNFEEVDHINEAKGFSCFCSSKPSIYSLLYE
ncbi:SAUR auxin-responsive protein family [Trifolium repens]|nr:SAUR auxin-responsive protein family [Trifolium repens]